MGAQGSVQLRLRGDGTHIGNRVKNLKRSQHVVLASAKTTPLLIYRLVLSAEDRRAGGRRGGAAVDEEFLSLDMRGIVGSEE